MKIKVKVQRKTKCPNCGGRGKIQVRVPAGRGWKDAGQCPRCKGTGKIYE
jgi:DnaJ-class molecular chaperone